MITLEESQCGLQTLGRHSHTQSKTMTAVGVVQIFVVALIIIMSVCGVSTDDSLKVTCQNVTGTVRESVTLSCNVSLLPKDCCITMYMFKKDDKKICIKEFPVNSCERENSYTCVYNPKETMTTQFKFFIQATCGMKRTLFTVNITEPETVPKPKIDANKQDPTTKEEPEVRRKVNVVPALVCSIFIITIFITAVIYKKTKCDCPNSSGFQSASQPIDKTSGGGEVV
ncbi:uncharacterized protein LOC127633734 [Xyrauchen texanus]|uniref:uncharacterized protein LOC127633734 n=1 Tax=Xyrauchen texanus TaxID=154827 RepID=UPI00224253C2|nr:uncharacterized protein LOC127633734 [Xyrauchen texanus]XP_051968975.1 uncharacterized protein LOC127633734 [Xyrauchen texanus]